MGWLVHEGSELICRHTTRELCPPSKITKQVRITASMLSGVHHLTRLELVCVSIEPGILSGKTRLQHLELAAPGTMGCDISGSSEGVRELSLRPSSANAAAYTSQPGPEFEGARPSSSLLSLDLQQQAAALEALRSPTARKGVAARLPNRQAVAAPVVSGHL
jgi:hypothetical protein